MLHFGSREPARASSRQLQPTKESAAFSRGGGDQRLALFRGEHRGGRGFSVFTILDKSIDLPGTGITDEPQLERAVEYRLDVPDDPVKALWLTARAQTIATLAGRKSSDVRSLSRRLAMAWFQTVARNLVIASFAVASRP